MKKSVKDGDFIFMEYREDDFNGISRLWELTGMGSRKNLDSGNWMDIIYIIRDIEKL